VIKVVEDVVSWRWLFEALFLASSSAMFQQAASKNKMHRWSKQ